MKRLVLILLMCVLSITHALSETIVNESNLQLLSATNQELLSLLKNDTITIVSNISLSPNYKITYLHPDTIWIKHKRKPQENKHYYLQYVWDGEPTNHNNEYGFPEYKNAKKPEGKFLFKEAQYPSYNIVVEDFESERDIIIPMHYCSELYSSKKENQISKDLLGKQIYYTTSKLFDNAYKTTITGVSYKIINKEGQLKSQCNLTLKNGLTGDIETDGMLHLYDRNKIIDTFIILTHNEFDSISEFKIRNEQFLSLAIIDGIDDSKEHMFVGDTMALYQIDKVSTDNWNEEQKPVYYCYAYGEKYSFGNSWYDAKITLLTPSDTTFLLNQGHRGVAARLNKAKEWDKKNDWLIHRDLEWDTTKTILAKIKWDDIIVPVDSYGDKEYSSVSAPKIGTEVPVILYGHDHDFLASFRILYEGQYFACDWRGLDFENQEEYYYLMRRGLNGLYDRVRKAIVHSIVKNIMSSIDEQIEQEKQYKKKQTFLISYDDFDSGYDWVGINMHFYNCFKKTIKYINCTITAYNYFGDIQQDQFGRSSKEVRCIGPIDVGEYGEYNFEDIFKDGNGIISYYRVTNIKFTFLDNSTQSYSGWAKIKPHIAQ